MITPSPLIVSLAASVSWSLYWRRWHWQHFVVKWSTERACGPVWRRGSTCQEKESVARNGRRRLHCEAKKDGGCTWPNVHHVHGAQPQKQESPWPYDQLLSWPVLWLFRVVEEKHTVYRSSTWSHLHSIPYSANRWYSAQEDQYW